jgi:hypothetical protein
MAISASPNGRRKIHEAGTLDAFRELVGELERDTAPEAVTDYVGPTMAERD